MGCQPAEHHFNQIGLSYTQTTRQDHICGLWSLQSIFLPYLQTNADLHLHTNEHHCQTHTNTDTANEARKHCKCSRHLIRFNCGNVFPHAWFIQILLFLWWGWWFRWIWFLRASLVLILYVHASNHRLHWLTNWKLASLLGLRENDVKRDRGGLDLLLLCVFGFLQLSPLVKSSAQLLNLCPILPSSGHLLS